MSYCGCFSTYNCHAFVFPRILVLDAGQIAEFDSPEHLLEQKSGIFYTMAKDAGLTE